MWHHLKAFFWKCGKLSQIRIFRWVCQDYYNISWGAGEGGLPNLYNSFPELFCHANLKCWWQRAYLPAALGILASKMNPESEGVLTAWLLLTHCMRRPGGADWHSLPSTDCQSPRCKKRESELTNHSSHNHNHLLPIWLSPTTWDGWEEAKNFLHSRW